MQGTMPRAGFGRDLCCPSLGQQQKQKQQKQQKQKQQQQQQQQQNNTSNRTNKSNNQKDALCLFHALANRLPLPP
jgi:hypothetical protein